jgi:hypothetical protein
VLDKDSKVVAVIVGVGGFLGIGEREVALDYSSLNVKYDPSAMTNAGATTIQAKRAWITLRRGRGTPKDTGISRPPITK